MAATTDLLTAARAEALFSSAISTGSAPTGAEVAAAIRSAVRTHGGIRGCATILAGEYGEHPEAAAHRMRWALSTIRSTYSAQSGDPATRASARTAEHHMHRAVGRRADRRAMSERPST